MITGSRSTTGFTLIELLAVICIISLLATLVLTGLNQAQTRMMRTKSLSQFQQIGMALQAYASDQDGKLPGPSYTGLNAVYNTSNQSHTIVGLLAPYLGLPAATASDQIAKVFIPAGFERCYKNPVTRPYMIMTTVPWKSPLWPQHPFGYESPVEPSMTIAAVASATSYSGSWIFAELDQGVTAMSSAGWYSQLPKTPPRGDGARNVLYADGHVEAIPIKIKFW
ncbi:MAG: hypothetical protein B9S32_07960 [Verrucomicrobia bacterium Tous-C9LFEB]|nr:MAG: hypothetical protein B9S32_07960 [Verrucomicrobia bacterium Tous-C9LFEB]